MMSASMDAREIAEAISEGINRLFWLIERDAFDDETKADVERLVDALEAMKSPAIMTSFHRRSCSTICAPFASISTATRSRLPNESREFDAPARRSVTRCEA